MMMKFFHVFHLVSLSPWPLLCSFSIMNLMLSLLLLLNKVNDMILYFSILILLMNLFQWWRDVIRESTFQGTHSLKVVMGLKMSMLMFILSEVMFFLSFFWSYFHMFLSPSIEIGMMWPPMMILKFNPLAVPMLNTLILLCSGMYITLCHFMLMLNNNFYSIIFLFITVILGLLFVFLQYDEYKMSFFSIKDSVCGSLFYVLTGFHGMHVIVGTLFLIIMFVRFLLKHFSCYHFIGFEFSSWYWHFVDVVWLFLYLIIYWMM
uniref:Cytochrome c oxidase subunit 3 n=1 Tax=Phanerotoma flava TaxID=684660 RepID=D8WHA7_9HYME|nr:cytochrome c oxidase subunit III [Phanerotoma flava]